MGNDGGSIAKRSDLAKDKKRPLKIDKAALRAARARLCALTQEPLAPPIVACKLGFLFNKPNLLIALSQKSLPKSLQHISKLKDIKDANIAQAPDSDRFICPISGLELNGSNRFIINWNCGCVMSEASLKEIPSKNCLVCGEPIAETISLNQSEEEQRSKRKSLVKSKNNSKDAGQPIKKAKLAEEDPIMTAHLKNMENEVYKSLFVNDNVDETFTCRHLRAGLR
ncbi:unnamed protein product [Blepharisma stoltei]|uniref:Replication termination factor 2 n=1 Tax=Blepharisma stoltei TaxID=1481888 RepID=A0AAU9IJB3_9CILI|nr:unnamed protein product [Blepharisma stoltei]